MKSLANTEQFPKGVGVAVNRVMLAWHEGLPEIHKKNITAWDGKWFNTGTQYFPHACEIPAKQKDENSFVRNGVRYVAEKHENSNCSECDMYSEKKSLEFDACKYNCNGISCRASERKDGMSIKWKLAELKTRPMTDKEIYELDRQGAAFAMFAKLDEGKYSYPTQAVVAITCREIVRYCLPCDMTDEPMAMWKWRPLTKECEG